ncbi:hypothetical protein Ddc_18448 [Ditylenchus destructor]|nr:hypothetical protein Ddc_18448 [Ditylenchus destructor]
MNKVLGKISQLDDRLDYLFKGVVTLRRRQQNCLCQHDKGRYAYGTPPYVFQHITCHTTPSRYPSRYPKRAGRRDRNKLMLRPTLRPRDRRFSIRKRKLFMASRRSITETPQALETGLPKAAHSVPTGPP